MAHIVLMLSSLFLLLLITHSSAGEDDNSKLMSFLGCYRDSRIRDLTENTEIRSQNLTVSLCFNYCRGLKYKYFGLQNGTICRCGSKHKVWYGSSCNSTCSGNQNETCGGIRQNSIYRITDAATPDLKAEYVRCVKDFRRDRDFIPETLLTDKNLTIEMCMTHCYKLGYAQMGLQLGENCRCGETSKYTRPEGRCNMPCKGNKEQKICGDYLGNAVYMISETSSFRYAEGCHDFNEDFFKDKLTITATEMKRGICSKFCKGYHYMSLKNGSTCYCHMETLLSASTAQSHCNMTCSGSPEDTGLDKRCGARDAVNVYGLTELTYRGCFMDPDSGISPPKGRWDDWLTYNEYHNVSTLNNKFDWISVEKCAERCFLSSYPYMSLSHKLCSCLMDLTRFGVETGCQKRCSRRFQICGEVGKSSVYQLDMTLKDKKLVV